MSDGTPVVPAKRPWTEAEDALIRSRYAEMGAAEMAPLLGRSAKAVYNRVSGLGLATRTLRPWTTADDQALRDMALTMTLTDAAAVLGRTVGAVIQHASYLGIHMRNAAEGRMLEAMRGFRPLPVRGPTRVDPSLQALRDSGAIGPRTLTWRSVCEDYFASVQYADQAYILGLLAADGCVVNDRCVQFGLIAKDVAGVEFVRDHLSPRARLSHLADGRLSLQVTSRRMVADLLPLGIVPRKSRLLEWPHSLGALQRPFLLGYFDGDGWIYAARDRHDKPRPGWGVCSGSRQFIEDLAAFTEAETGVGLWEIQHREDADLWQTSVTGMGAWVLDEWMHQEGLGLRRKYQPAVRTAGYRALAHPA